MSRELLFQMQPGWLRGGPAGLHGWFRRSGFWRNAAGIETG